jgi:hypothetical protein
MMPAATGATGSQHARAAWTERINMRAWGQHVGSAGWQSMQVSAVQQPLWLHSKCRRVHHTNGMPLVDY